ncbi:MAG: hypothetical protein WBP55_06470 [Solirubrobacterales bacterium]
MPTQPLSIRAVFAAMRSAADQNRTTIIRMTLVAAALSTILVPLQESGIAGIAISVGLSVLIQATYGSFIYTLICVPGEQKRPGELWPNVQQVLNTVIWIMLFVAVCALATIVLIVPPLILVTIWSVAVPAAVVEKTAVFESLGRSRELVRGNGWRVFGFVVLMTLLTFAVILVGGILALPFGTGLAGLVAGNFILICVAFPVLFLGPAALYNQLAELNSAPTTPESGLEPPL